MEIDETKFETAVFSVLGKLDEILSCVKARNILNGERLYDNQDLCLMLKLSKRSLQRYRSLGALKYFQIGQKTLYYESDVKKFIKEYLSKDNTGRDNFTD
ncbi:helix-turn-helix domain-containing protein [Dysgonomonas sp. Marseille-P4677]|uniref:helix-turn-helix domain-containing protein n=1 Tax=Dysgonomonas sp. Marseille-P4677 TaxID=2364790 RepID=UPI00191414A1|nr:helix-turn-helix domain-containing protein [Dysgonomonas sp. Marseille-P4677]MBK5719536.1 helix-turn-helix domain-containing protein [Dysgonomonas sp. Marseille-P4677]